MTARLLNLSPVKLLRALLSRYLLFQAPQSHFKKCLAMLSRDVLASISFQRLCVGVVIKSMGTVSEHTWVLIPVIANLRPWESYFTSLTSVSLSQTGVVKLT